MKKEVQAQMEANLKENEVRYRANAESIKAEAERENLLLNIDNNGKQTFEIYQSYYNAGFTKEQAWELTKIMVSNSTAPRHASLF